MLKGKGLLSLWNGFDPARLDEYDQWHTRQHVPERLAVDGMLSARRYDRGQGPLPEFLTFYEMRSTEVLSSAPYRRLLDNPSAWSRTMRSSFEGFFRVGHLVELTKGGGVGGAIIATTFDDLTGWAEATRKKIAKAVLEATQVTAIHMLARDVTVAPVPFAVAAAPKFPQAAAIMVESYGRKALDDARDKIDAILARHGVAKDRLAWTSYELAYVLDREDLGQVVSLDGPV